jgi:hypothetical protein
MLDDHDRRTIRCRRLGHEVTFYYCRTQEGGSVCSLILDCWWEAFDVRAFLQEHLGEEEVERLAERRPRPKVLTLIELIEQARRRAEEGDDA